MVCVNGIRKSIRVASLANQPYINGLFKRFRKPSICDVCLGPPDKKPCFDIRNVSVELGTQCHAKLIRSFLCTHYWTREPSIIGLWMPLDCPYLNILTDRYSYSGDRFLAFEHTERTRERKLVGVCVANKVLPWMIDELEEWAHFTASKPERHRMYFNAHCLKRPKVFDKYQVPYIYDIQVLGSVSEVAGQGVGKLLLRTALTHAHELRHPVVQLVSLNQYTSRICEYVGMKLVWTMDYNEFVDNAGQRVFSPRRPHTTVAIYVKSLGSEPTYKPQVCQT